jgi:hypothetical protein
MTIVTLKAVGLCAHPSPTGDRAFRYALALARHHGIKLNVFSFLDDPFDPEHRRPEPKPEERSREIIRADRELREYYDSRAADYLEVGFKVCEGREELELRRCLKRGEYQLLVIPYLERGGWFGTVPVEEFARRFLAPVVLVGPWRKVRYYVNAQAALIADRLHLYEGTWRTLPEVESNCRIA